MISIQSLCNGARVLAGAFFVCVFMYGCAVTAPQTARLHHNWPAGLKPFAELTHVPFFPQTEYQCGPASLATVLVQIGVDTRADALIDLLYIPARRGSVQIEMAAAARRFDAVSYVLEPELESVLREIAGGSPVIVLQNFAAGPFRKWHYAVAVGYDEGSGTIVLRSGQQRRTVLPLAGFEHTWAASGHWAMITVPPGQIPVTAERDSYFEAIRALEVTGHARAAAAAYAAFSARWPDHIGGYIGLANAQYALGEFAEAEKALRSALLRYPESVVALNNLAQTLSDQGRSEEALAVIDRAAEPVSPFRDAVNDTRRLILQKLNDTRGGAPATSEK